MLQTNAAPTHAPRETAFLDSIGTLLPVRKLPLPLAEALEKLLGLNRFDTLYREIRGLPGGRVFSQKLLAELNVKPVVAPEDLERIPRQGPVIVVANHPFGLIEGCILAALLPALRSDCRIMTNSLLAAIPELSDVCLWVNPFGGAGATNGNRRGLRESISLLRAGGMLAVFPAGEVAHMSLKRGGITDPEWNQNVARLVRMTGASVLPVYFHGANGPVFQILGMLHPRLRTAMLPNEFFNKQDRSVELRIGNLISGKRLAAIETDDAMTEYLRERTYLLRHRQPAPRHAVRSARLEPIDAPVDPHSLADEVRALPAETLLLETGGIEVRCAEACRMPRLLKEIGRLRELTFRAVGEGTGLASDIDEFDDHYLHLFLWHPETREVLGAYRLAPTDQPSVNPDGQGLYTRTLFSYDRRFLSKLGPAIELGRSFVRLEQQKSFSALLLLWKGIGAFVARHPRYRKLFGPVSISNEYLPISRQLMVTYLNRQHLDAGLAQLVKAHNPFRSAPFAPRGEGLRNMHTWDIEELSASIAEIETGHKGLPVLLRQYLKLGGSLVAFNVDRHFANALDGLIVVDLERTERRALERYMGKDQAAAFLQGC